MPDRTISFLSAACGILVFTYIVLVITTITFAAWRTDHSAAVRNTEAQIASLESKYYDSVAKLDSTNPNEVGLVAPASVRYAIKVESPTLTLR